MGDCTPWEQRKFCSIECLSFEVTDFAKFHVENLFLLLARCPRFQIRLFCIGDLVWWQYPVEALRVPYMMNVNILAFQILRSLNEEYLVDKMTVMIHFYIADLRKS